MRPKSLWLPATPLLVLECPKVTSPQCGKLRDEDRELGGSKGWAALMQILLVVKRDEKGRSVETESAPDRIYGDFFCLLPGRLLRVSEQHFT